MIFSFGNKSTEDLFHGILSKDSLQIPQQVWTATVRKLDMIQSANQVMDLKSPPGNRLEKLKRNRLGQYSIRINDQYRVVFEVDDGNATHVAILDYHR